MSEKSQKTTGLSPRELAVFCSQIAMILQSGIPLYEGMDALAQSHGEDAAARIYRDVSNGVTGTGSLYAALKEDGRWPGYLVEMTGIGERTGRLEDVMRGLALYYERDRNIRRAVRSAVTYPMVLACMMAVIIVILLLKVLPVFREVLSGMGVNMTDSGTAMMRLGAVIGWVVLGVLAVLLLAAGVCLLLLRTGAAGKVRAGLAKLFPGLGRVSRSLSAARVASVLSMMLSGGIPLDESMSMAASVLTEPDAKQAAEKAAAQLQAGEPFAEAVTGTGLFDEVYNCMIRTGCSVGCADTVMEKVAADCEEAAEEDISALVGIIEPTLVGVLCVIIGSVMLAVMLPMAGMISSIL